MDDLIKSSDYERRKHNPRSSRVTGVKLPSQVPIQQYTNIQMKDLRRLGLLGCGGYGAVTLEQHKTTGQTFALKMLSKGFIVKTKMQNSVKREKEILSLCDSDFVIRLYSTFKDEQNLYFLLEPALGGELYASYHKYRWHGDVRKAKYYSATVVFCFEHLH